MHVAFGSALFGGRTRLSMQGTATDRNLMAALQLQLWRVCTQQTTFCRVSDKKNLTKRRSLGEESDSSITRRFIKLVGIEDTGDDIGHSAL
jgi:hypothetical protein